MEPLGPWATTTLVRQHEIEFRFNPPRASHFGGVFESLIRLCRRPISLALDEQRLTEEAFITVLAEVERLINSRPLVPLSDDPDDLSALTPADLLLFRSGTPLPPGLFSEGDRLRHRWRQVQALTHLFWRKFVLDYLPLLIKRQKWLRPKRNLHPGDLVLLREDNVPRGHWPMARIINVRTSSDDLVRSVTLKTRQGQYNRPIHRVILLEASE